MGIIRTCHLVTTSVQTKGSHRGRDRHPMSYGGAQGKKFSPGATGPWRGHSALRGCFLPGASKIKPDFFSFNVVGTEQAILDKCLNPFSQPDCGAWQGLCFTPFGRGKQGIPFSFQSREAASALAPRMSSKGSCGKVQPQRFQKLHEQDCEHPL